MHLAFTFQSRGEEKANAKSPTQGMLSPIPPIRTGARLRKMLSFPKNGKPRQYHFFISCLTGDSVQYAPPLHPHIIASPHCYPSAVKGSIMSNTQKDFLAEDGELSLIYFKLHKSVLEASVKFKLNATALNTFMYLGLNSLTSQGVSHRFEVEDIADYLGKVPRSIYRALAALEKAKLIKIRDHGAFVCDIPSVIQATKEATKRAKEKHAERQKAEFEKQVKEHEAVLGRQLTKPERKRLQRHLDGRE